MVAFFIEHGLKLGDAYKLQVQFMGLLLDRFLQGFKLAAKLFELRSQLVVVVPHRNGARRDPAWAGGAPGPPPGTYWHQGDDCNAAPRECLGRSQDVYNPGPTEIP